MAKTKALISFAVTAKLICVFVFACAKRRFSYNEADMCMYYFQRHKTGFLVSSLNFLRYRNVIINVNILPVLLSGRYTEVYKFTNYADSENL